MTLKFIQEAEPDTATIKTIEEGLVSYNSAIAGHHNRQPLWLIGRNEKGAIKAWLFVDWLWVAEGIRKKGYGSSLLSQAEQIAKERGCLGVFLDSYSFQAPEFYAKHGYKEFGRINNFPIDHSRIYFSKHFE